MSGIQPGYPVAPRGPGAGTIVLLSIITSVLASAATVIALERFGLPGLLPGSDQSAPFVEVPELIGMRQAAADEIMRARGLRLIVNEHRADPAPVDTVVAQKPLSGSQVRKGDPVSVALSTGPGQVKVPELLTRSLAEAKLLLEQAGLKVAEVKETPGDAPGTILSATPAPGSAVEPGSAVVLEVAKEATIKVPELIGMHVRKAKEALEQVGLPVGKISERYDRHKRGNLVLEQTPSAGTEVPKDTEVALIVNQGDY